MGRGPVGCLGFKGSRTLPMADRDRDGVTTLQRRSGLDLLSCAPRLGESAQGSFGGEQRWRMAHACRHGARAAPWRCGLWA